MCDGRSLPGSIRSFKGPEVQRPLLFFNSSHLVNWEHLRAVELKPTPPPPPPTDHWWSGPRWSGGCVTSTYRTLQPDVSFTGGNQPGRLVPASKSELWLFISVYPPPITLCHSRSHLHPQGVCVQSPHFLSSPPIKRTALHQALQGQ